MVANIFAVDGRHDHEECHVQTKDAADIEAFHHALSQAESAKDHPRDHSPAARAQTVHHAGHGQECAGRAQRHAWQTPAGVREKITVERRCQGAQQANGRRKAERTEKEPGAKTKEHQRDGLIPFCKEHRAILSSQQKAELKKGLGKVRHGRGKFAAHPVEILPVTPAFLPFVEGMRLNGPKRCIIGEDDFFLFKTLAKKKTEHEQQTTQRQQRVLPPGRFGFV